MVANVPTRHICYLNNPPLTERKVLPNRAVKSKSSKELTHVNWIRCDVCKSWCQLDCCGLSQKDHKKLTSGDRISSASDAVFLIRVASKTRSSIRYPTSPTYAKCNLVMFQSAPVESEPRITSR